MYNISHFNNFMSLGVAVRRGGRSSGPRYAITPGGRSCEMSHTRRCGRALRDWGFRAPRSKKQVREPRLLQKNFLDRSAWVNRREGEILRHIKNQQPANLKEDFLTPMIREACQLNKKLLCY